MIEIVCLHLTLSCLVFNVGRMFVYFLLRLFFIVLSTMCLNGKPSIVFFLIDDKGWTDLGYLDSNYDESANIDKDTRPDNVLKIVDTIAFNYPPRPDYLISGEYSLRQRLYTITSLYPAVSGSLKDIRIKNTSALTEGKNLIAASSTTSCGSKIANSFLIPKQKRRKQYS